MTTNTTRKSEPLEDVLYMFSLAKARPDAELLDSFIRQYPEYADDLVNFAIEVVVDADRGDDETAIKLADTAVSPVVSRVMSRFQNNLFALQSKQKVTSTSQQIGVHNPFAVLDRVSFRMLADDLGVNTLFLTKLRDRVIDPNTLSDGFVHLVAAKVKAPLATLIAHFRATPGMQPGQSYKSDQKPEVGPQQSFEQAVRSSCLSEEQQQHLMSL